MKTSNRPTASEIQTANELTELARRVRKIWSAHLRAVGDEREHLIVELSEVDTQIERLTIRAQCEVFSQIDKKIMVNAEARVEELERRWHQTKSPELTIVGAAA